MEVEVNNSMGTETHITEEMQTRENNQGSQTIVIAPKAVSQDIKEVKGRTSREIPEKERKVEKAEEKGKRLTGKRSGKHTSIHR